MATRIQELKWILHNYKTKKILIWGLKHGFIIPYNESLIEKLRTITYGGIPASIILLSDGLTNGNCYDRAVLLSRAFFDEEDDIKLLYATIDSLKLNPKYAGKEDPLFYDHCIVERITKEGLHLIYDTSSGFIYDKKLYWLSENPKIRKVNNKKSIIKFVEKDEDYHPENIERDKYVAPLILPLIEETYGRPNEMYSALGIEMLQKEIEHFKKEINYDDICKEIDDNIKRLGLKM